MSRLFLGKGHKSDLIELATEIGETIISEAIIANIKDIIADSKSYDEEFVVQVFEIIIEEKVKRKQNEKLVPKNTMKFSESVLLQQIHSTSQPVIFSANTVAQTTKSSLCFPPTTTNQLLGYCLTLKLHKQLHHLFFLLPTAIQQANLSFSANTVAQTTKSSLCFPPTTTKPATGLFLTLKVTRATTSSLLSAPTATEPVNLSFSANTVAQTTKSSLCFPPTTTKPATGLLFYPEVTQATSSSLLSAPTATQPANLSFSANTVAQTTKSSLCFPPTTTKPATGLLFYPEVTQATTSSLLSAPTATQPASLSFSANTVDQTIKSSLCFPPTTTKPDTGSFFASKSDKVTTSRRLRVPATRQPTKLFFSTPAAAQTSTPFLFPVQATEGGAALRFSFAEIPHRTTPFIFSTTSLTDFNSSKKVYRKKMKAKGTGFRSQRHFHILNKCPNMFKIKKYLACMHNDRNFSDFELRVNNESFFAHKEVLSAMSPVFKAMLLSGMKETVNNLVDIKDLSSETLRQMLLFMYTDSVEDLTWASTKDLYSAADKYDISSLRSRCVQLLRTQLSTSNACEALVFADLHQDAMFKMIVQYYIMRQGREIFFSNEWRSFIQENPLLAAEVMYLKLREIYERYNIK
ncbi:TD and POZ domain-containing protein 4 [Caerostris extrusa]|uniref:TD and POZ domain-containing protein 4 n=1 Tax=Caerostris extrusa TaxID=172846 RepID=A0AAV4YA08_CAEEX|nr:TD and POZ domain-containing protein 4 [Caerostris extrusa]